MHPDFPSFNFDTTEGLTWEVAIFSPARCNRQGEVICRQANRIVGLAFDGQPLAPDQRFLLATNS